MARMEGAAAIGGRRGAERRQAILRELEHKPHVQVASLSQELGVSQVSIRRDLAILEGLGLVRRVHGGAEALAPDRASVFQARLLQNRERKQAIGQAAASLIQPGDSVLLDSGTTVLEVARHIPQSLPANNELLVVTRSLQIAYELSKYPQVRLIVLGGLYLPNFDVFYGPKVKTALEGVHVDILFLSIDGVSLERGLTTDNVLEADLYQHLDECATRVVAVADSSKIGVDQLQAILTFDQIDTFITDSGAPQDFVYALHGRGIEVLIVQS